MKKLLMIGLVVSLMAGMFVVPTLAQFTTVTSFRVQNLSTQTANIQLMYYNASGAVETGATANDTINANSSKQYVQANNTALPTGFNGSVVIASDQPVAAIGIQDAVSGVAPSDIHYQGTYGGFSATDAAAKFYLPVIMRNYYNYSTEISIQNAGTSAVNATITYSNGYSETISGIQPGAVKRVANSTNTNLGGAGSFNGSAIIDATGPIVAVVNEQSLLTKEEQTYEGVSVAKAGNTLYVPNLMKQYYLWNTSFQVQNVGTTATDITVTLSSGMVYTWNLAAGASKLYVQNNEASLPIKWLGSAVVQAAPGGTITAIVHGQDPTNHKAAAFNAFAASATKFVAPDVMRRFYNYTSSVQVMNVGSAAASCTAHYVGTNLTGTVTLDEVSRTTVNPMGTYLFVQENNPALGERFGGSVELTCSGQPFVAIVNQNGPLGHGDNAMAYNAFPAQ